MTHKLYDYDELPSDIWALRYKPTLGEELDQLDWIGHVIDESGELKDVNYKHDLINPEFSNDNKKVLLEVMDELRSKGTLNSICEVGVNRSKAQSSTVCMLNAKPQDTKYFGIDLAEHNMSSVRDHSKNIYCLATDSSNTKEILEWCKSFGTEKFSILLIDGYHSCSQVLRDFALAEYVEVGGYVIFHDISAHPGPHLVIDAIDQTIFEVKKYFCEKDDDWGLGVCKRLK